MYLLDTNVVSELRRAKKADPSVRAWAQTLPAANLYLSVISVLELEMGVLLIERRDRKQGRILRAWMDGHVLPTFAGRVLAIDTTVALRCAALHVPDPCSDRDALIAATALVHDREGAPQAVVAWGLFRIPKGLKCVERREAGRGAGVHAPQAEFTFRTYCRQARN